MNATESVHCIMVLDQSGSMEDVKTETYKSIQQFIRDRKDDKIKTYFSLVKFSFSSAIETVYDRADVSTIDVNFSYVPNGGTALYQAIGQTIEKYNRETSKVVFVIATDGHDNASIGPYTKKSVNEQINEKKKSGWEFLFLGANQEQFDESANIGVHNVAYFQMCGPSVSCAFQGASRAISGYVQSGRMPSMPSMPTPVMPSSYSSTQTPVSYSSTQTQVPLTRSLSVPDADDVWNKLTKNNEN